MNYENKLTCFIDILGFKSAIKQAETQVEVREALYRTLTYLTSDELLNTVYGDIPFYTLDENNTMKPYREVCQGNLIEDLREDYPIAITQFSDSFVLSCPANNHATCAMLLRCVYLIHLHYYQKLGMMVRGGISLGNLIHEESGALFGPAMNNAYALESKSAIYPRVIISPEAYTHLSTNCNKNPEYIPIKTAFDGHKVFDLVSILTCPKWEIEETHEIDDHLKEIETDVIVNSSAAHPKIAYLLDQWDAYKMQNNISVE